jgi:hypothetical protein
VRFTSPARERKKTSLVARADFGPLRASQGRLNRSAEIRVAGRGECPGAAVEFGVRRDGVEEAAEPFVAPEMLELPEPLEPPPLDPVIPGTVGSAGGVT